MTIPTQTKIRLALLTTVATAGLIAACGGGDDSSSPTDAGTKDATTSTPDASTSGPEAGLADAGALDASDAAVVIPPLSCTGYLYCEDFEGYVDSGTIASGTPLGPWTTNTNGVTDAGEKLSMGVDEVKPSTGLRSLHLTAPAGEFTAGTLHRMVTADAGIIGGNLYGRVMIFFSNGPLPGGSAPETDSGVYGLPTGHAWEFNSAGTSPEEHGEGISMNLLAGSPTLGLNYQSAKDAGYGEQGAGSNKNADGGVMTTGSWHCLQWQYDGSGSPPNDAARVWLDGVRSVTVDAGYDNGDFKLSDSWASFDLGFTHYQLMPLPVDVYIDDFALGTEMVACPVAP